MTPGMKADSASAVADWGERNMGDKQTLTDFVSWSKTNYPADHYALYFWGMAGAGTLAGSWKMTRTVTLSTTTRPRRPSQSLGFVDVVGYDGCNMASLEIIDLWHGHATAVTGSQEYVGWDGLEYDVFLNQLKANPTMSADALAIASSQSTVTDKTWSAVAVDTRLNTLVTAVDQWSIALKNGMTANKKTYTSAIGLTKTFNQAPMDKDLYDLATKINAKVTDAPFEPGARPS